MISVFRRNKTTLGLDVGSGFVKAAVVDHSGPEPALVQVAYLPMVADAIVEGEVMDPLLVVDSIRSVVEMAGGSSKNIVTSVGGRDVIVKKIQMDRMPVDDAREVIRWEAEQYVPFDMEGVQLDFQILDPDSDGLQMNVLLVAAKRELVDQKVSLLNDAGVTPTVIDVDAFALHNAFEYNYPEAGSGLATLVNVGHEISTVNVLQDGVPVLTRDVPFGSRRLREELRRAHGLTSEEAEAVIQGRSEQLSQFEGVLSDRGEELALGIERAMAFLSMDISPARGNGNVYLCGGGAHLPRLVDAVARRLNARVEIANPLRRLQVGPSATSTFPVDELAPMLMLPVGLALRAA